MLRRAGEESPDLACYLVLSAATGARRSELIALRWTDVDLDAATVSIERSIVMGPSGLVEEGTKTHSARRVSLDAGTVGVLVDHRDRLQERAAACGAESANNSFVFSNAADASTPWRPDSVSRSFRRLCEREGMASVRLHDLRAMSSTSSFAISTRCRSTSESITMVSSTAWPWKR